MDQLLQALAYVPIVATSAFLHYSDIYLLQAEPGPVHRSQSFWLYLVAQVLVALLAAFLLYEKGGLAAGDWPIVTGIASLGGFSVIQSFSLKLGDKGIALNDLIGAWKARVLTDVRKAATTAKAREQRSIARRLAAALADRPQDLKAAVRHLAASTELDPKDEVERATSVPGLDRTVALASWVAGTDLQYAKDLLEEQGKV